MVAFERGRASLYRFVILGAVLAIGLAGCGKSESTSGVVFTSYDDFSALLNLQKWNGCEFDRDAPSGALRLAMNCVGMAANNHYEVQANTITSAAITEFQADVVIAATAVIAANGKLRASIEINYQPAAYRNVSWQDFSGARIEFLATAAGLKVRSYTFACTNAPCSSTVNSTPTEIAAGLSYDTAYTANIAFDGTSTWTFTVTPVGDTAFTATTAGMPDTLLTIVPTDFVYSRYNLRFDNGNTGGSSASATTTIDEVMENSSGTLASFDTFDNPTIDTTKWSLGDMSRHVVDGVLVQTQTQGNLEQSLRTSIPGASSIHGIKADVTLTAVTLTGSSVGASARIGRWLYNDGTAGDGLGGRNGDVLALLRQTDASVDFYVLHCVTGACTEALALYGANVATVTVNTAHNLQLYWDGTNVQYALDGATETSYDPSAVAAIASTTPNGGDGIFLDTRVSNTADGLGTAIPATESGVISASFDNVATAP